METPQKARTLLLAVLALPLMFACRDEIIRPEPYLQEEPRMVVRPSEVFLVPGEVFLLEVVIVDGDDEISPADIDLEWNCDNPNVVQPLGEGLIRGLEAGLAVIVADYRGFTAEATVRVTKEKKIGDWK